MEKCSQYREIIRSLLTQHIAIDRQQPTEGVESSLVVDEQTDTYIWLGLGWQRGRRVKNIYVIVRLVEGKFYIEEDRTEAGLAQELLDAGIPKEDIVLAFHPPELRQYSEFAVA